MVKRIQLKDSHKQKAKELRIYGRLMKSIENYIREQNNFYMNSREFIDAYNKHILMLNNKSWNHMIYFAFDWTYNDPTFNDPRKWYDIANHFSK